MGGWTVEWVEGDKFLCLISKSGSVDQLIAQQQGNNAVFRITVPINLPIDFHDVFKSKETGRYYRVTEDPDDKRAPEIASFSVKVGSAESYQLPAG